MDTHVTQQLERGRFTATVTIEAEVLVVEALAVAIRRDIEVTNTRAVVVECLEPGGARILALVGDGGGVPEIREGAGSGGRRTEDRRSKRVVALERGREAGIGEGWS